MLHRIEAKLVPPLFNKSYPQRDQEWSTELSPRLNLITGDNGLGKTVLLELFWYCLTSTWVDRQIEPLKVVSESEDEDEEKFRNKRFLSPEISANILSNSQSIERKSRFEFAWEEWITDNSEEETEGIVIFARANGSYAIWDSTRTPMLEPKYDAAPMYGSRRKAELPDCFRFTSDDVLNGIRVDGKVWCRGLLNDWIVWKYVEQWQIVHHLFEQLITVLSDVTEPFNFSETNRLSPFDSEIYPILRMPYGKVPIHLASSGIRRVIDIAYLIAWAVMERGTHKAYLERAFSGDITIIIDEIELHLHPQWQRSILPSLMKVSDELVKFVGAKEGPVSNVQIIATSHSPMILASLETDFDENSDSVKVLEYQKGPNAIVLKPFNMSKQGDASKWLTSPVFGMKFARSRESEIAISNAIDFLTTGIGNKSEIEDALFKAIPDFDRFWVQWHLSNLGERSSD